MGPPSATPLYANHNNNRIILLYYHPIPLVCREDGPAVSGPLAALSPGPEGLVLCDHFLLRFTANSLEDGRRRLMGADLGAQTPAN